MKKILITHSWQDLLHFPTNFCTFPPNTYIWLFHYDTMIKPNSYQMSIYVNLSMLLFHQFTAHAGELWTDWIAAWVKIVRGYRRVKSVKGMLMQTGLMAGLYNTASDRSRAPKKCSPVHRPIMTSQIVHLQHPLTHPTSEWFFFHAVFSLISGLILLLK